MGKSTPSSTKGLTEPLLEVHIVTRFVTRPQAKKLDSTKGGGFMNVRPMSTASTITTRTNTPSNLSETNSPEVVSALAESALHKEEPDSAVLNCVSVTERCLKLGRITIPLLFHLP